MADAELNEKLARRRSLNGELSPADLQTGSESVKQPERADKSRKIEGIDSSTTAKNIDDQSGGNVDPSTGLSYEPSAGLSLVDPANIAADAQTAHAPQPVCPNQTRIKINPHEGKQTGIATDQKIDVDNNSSMALIRGAAIIFLVALLVPLLNLGKNGTMPTNEVSPAHAHSNGPAQNDRTQLDWKEIGVFNEVATFTAKIPNSELLAVRGLATANIHISKIVGPVFNSSEASSWIDMLKSQTDRQVENPDNEAKTEGNKNSKWGWNKKNAKKNQPPQPVVMHDVIYQYYDFPWPINDRDMVLQRKITFDAAKGEVFVDIKSVVDVNFPEVKDVIRGESPVAYWSFKWDKALQRTSLEGAVVVDLKGSLPAWLINQLQKMWPSKTINGLKDVARRGSSLPHALAELW